MSIITLTSDFGTKDYFVSTTKAAIINEIESVNIIDISHEISPFNITEAAYILKNAFKSFPRGSIHIVGVEAELTPENKHIVMKFEDHFFVGANNGIFSLIIENKKPQELYEINIHKNLITSFPVLEVFVKVAGHISRGGSLDVIGKKNIVLKELKNVNPVINSKNNQILGSVIYIDNYGNVVTNIKKKLFLNVKKNRNYTIKAGNIKINKINDSYSSVVDFSKPKNLRNEDGKKIAIFNKADHLELSIYKSNPLTVGSASTLFGLYFRDPVSIIFE